MMPILLRKPISLLGPFLVTIAIIASTTTAANGANATSNGSTSRLPDEVFWDHNDWPSDLISVGEFNKVNVKKGKVLDFLPLENPHIISGQSNLDSIVDDPEKLTAFFNENGYDEVEVRTYNGGWTGEIKLPDASTVHNFSEFQLTVTSSWSVKVTYNNGGKSLTVLNGSYLVLAVVEGVWLTKEEYTPSMYPTMAPTPVSQNENPPVLEGTVLFAQSQIFPSKHGIDGDNQLHLTALRKTLVMLRPNIATVDDIEPSLEMTVRDANGVVSFGPIEMKVPDDIPKQEGWIDIGNTNIDDIEFPLSLLDPYVIQYQANLNQIADDQEAVFLTNTMENQNAEVEIRTWNGSWVRNIYLPKGETIPSTSKVQLTCDSGYSVNVYYPNTQTGGWRRRTLSNGQKLVFILVNDTWIAMGDLAHNEYVFGHGFFTATLEAELVQQGMLLEFRAVVDSSGEEDQVGILDEIKIGGVTELVIAAIDAGFLTPPRNDFKFRNDELAQKEYFETAPVSRMVIAQYESLHLEEVMLPSGKLYTTVSDDDGGWHSGDMRQSTGKVLISHGIDLANYGITSSKSTAESSHPFTCALLAAHNTVGMYRNGRVVHGGSGGNGMITLDSSIGNEFSHEAGHNYGLGHYVGGFNGSVHRPSTEINSSWGWDSEKNIFFPNFKSDDSGSDTCLDDICQLPYLGKYKFGTDSMAGGSPMWSNRFTMYTPYVAKIIQSFLESKAVWDPTSSTGFRKFNQSTKEMNEFANMSNGEKVPQLYRVPVTTIVGYYDPSPSRGLADYVFPAMHGAYGFVYEDDSSSSTGTSDGCELHVKTQNTNGSEGENTLVYALATEVYHLDSMNKFHVNIATEDRPFLALVYCFDQLRTSRNLDGPNQDEPPLTFARYGIEFETQSPTPSAAPSEGLSEAQSPTPSAAPSEGLSEAQSPTPSAVPSEVPSTPLSSSCSDSPARFRVLFNGKKISRRCAWVAKKFTDERCELDGVAEMCPATCDTCSICENSSLRFTFEWRGKTVSKNCVWVARKLTEERCNEEGVTESCRATCEGC